VSELSTSKRKCKIRPYLGTIHAGDANSALWYGDSTGHVPYERRRQYGKQQHELVYRRGRALRHEMNRFYHSRKYLDEMAGERKKQHPARQQPGILRQHSAPQYCSIVHRQRPTSDDDDDDILTAASLEALPLVVKPREPYTARGRGGGCAQDKAQETAEQGLGSEGQNRDERQGLCSSSLSRIRQRPRISHHPRLKMFPGGSGCLDHSQQK
jgi:hypothetical protein